MDIYWGRMEQRTVRLRPEEKAWLVRLACLLGGLLSKFCILVYADTLKKWIRQDDGGLVFKRSRLGRPPTFLPAMWNTRRMGPSIGIQLYHGNMRVHVESR